MGISPIAGLMPLPVARSIQADLDPLPMQRVEMSPGTGDETYSPSGEGSARGSDHDAQDAETVYVASADDEFGGPTPGPESQSGAQPPIDLFA